MPSHSSRHISASEKTPPSESEAPSEDEDTEEPETGDLPRQEPLRIKPIRIPPRIQPPPSPSLSLSTTTSELEVEQGESLLRVKRLRPKEEELEDSIPSAEAISDESIDEPAPKKRRKTSSSMTKRHKKRKSGAKTHSG